MGASAWVLTPQQLCCWTPRWFRTRRPSGAQGRGLQSRKQPWEVPNPHISPRNYQLNAPTEGVLLVQLVHQNKEGPLTAGWTCPQTRLPLNKDRLINPQRHRP